MSSSLFVLVVIVSNSPDVLLIGLCTNFSFPICCSEMIYIIFLYSGSTYLNMRNCLNIAWYVIQTNAFYAKTNIV
jgi:hypothetical protein